jgi:hypothetical protein
MICALANCASHPLRDIRLPPATFDDNEKAYDANPEGHPPSSITPDQLKSYHNHAHETLSA